MRLLLAALLLALSSPVWALNRKAGTSAAQFLKLGAGSRAGAMAEAYSAVSDDVYAVYYNPAALTRLTRPQLAAAHTQHFQDISYEFAAFAIPMGKEKDHSRGVLAASIYNLSVKDISRRVDDTENDLGKFDAGDYSYNLSYAHALSRSVRLGLTAKLIHQTIDTYSSDAFAGDAGVLFQPRPDAAKPLSFSLVVKNLGTKPKFAGVTDPLPVGVVAGVGYEPLPKRFKMDLDLVKYRDTDPYALLGGEYLVPFGPDIGGALRAGFTTHRLANDGFNEMTLGVGLNFHRATFDFSWVPYGALGNTFRYSLLVRF